MRVIVVAGGTGGHIFPAIAIINKIKEKDKDSEILYIGTTDRMEKDIVPKLGIPFVGIPMAGGSVKLCFGLIFFLLFFPLLKSPTLFFIHLNPVKL